MPDRYLLPQNPKQPLPSPIVIFFVDRNRFKLFIYWIPAFLRADTSASALPLRRGNYERRGRLGFLRSGRYARITINPLYRGGEAAPIALFVIPAQAGIQNMPKA
jgi:hypothetical protein